MPSRAASLRRPDLPSRRPSTGASSRAPADAFKPDDEAVDDVYLQVDATGSLEAAAKKLAELAADGPTPAVQRRHEWWNDPEEQEFLEYEEEDDEGDYEMEHLNEVVDGLWIGDLVSAMDVDGLRERGIVSDNSDVLTIDQCYLIAEATARLLIRHRSIRCGDR